MTFTFTGGFDAVSPSQQGGSRPAGDRPNVSHCRSITTDNEGHLVVNENVKEVIYF